MVKQNPPEKSYLSPSACAAHYAKITGHSAADDGRLPLLSATYEWHVERCQRDVHCELRHLLKSGPRLKKRGVDGDAIWWARRDQLMPLFKQHFARHALWQSSHLGDPTPQHATHEGAQEVLGWLERMVENTSNRNNSVLRAFVRAARARWKVLGRAKDPTPAELASLAAVTGLDGIVRRDQARDRWKQRMTAWRDEPLSDVDLALAREDLALDGIHPITIPKCWPSELSRYPVPCSEISVELKETPSMTTPVAIVR